MKTKTLMSCSYPGCSNLIEVTFEQKRKFKTDYFLKYGKSIDVYCSKACQEKHMKELSKAEFVTRGPLKNHEYALIINGADLTKRPKETVLQVITGNVTKQRVGCVRDKLISMVPRKIANGKKVKCLFPKEIQTFILNELPGDLKVSESRVQVTASELIKIIPQAYPNEITSEKIDGKTRVLIYIK